jgi:hypothetical protein
MTFALEKAKREAVHFCARGSVVERFSDKEEVDGSIPSVRTSGRKRFLKPRSLVRIQVCPPLRCDFSKNRKELSFADHFRYFFRRKYITIHAHINSRF